MKLTYISIQNRPATTAAQIQQTNQTTQTIGPFCPGINFVYGERKAGKTEFYRWFRDLLVDDSRRFTNESFNVTGNPNRFRSGSVTLGDANLSNQLIIKRDFTGRRDLVANQASQAIDSTDQSDIKRYLNQTDGTLYDLIHGFSFRQTNQRFASLNRLLNERFHVPPGQVGDTHSELAWQKKQQQYQSLQNSIVALRARQLDLSHRRQRIQDDLTLAQESRQQKLVQIDAEIESVKSRLGSYSFGVTLDSRLDQVTREMFELSQQIVQLSQRKVPASNLHSSLSKEYFSQLYARLDELDEQIRRWKAVQEMVQQRRIKLKTEMDNWNQMTVDDHQHPYYQVRLILLDLENHVNQTDHQAKQWESNPANHTDPTQAVRSIKQLCSSMRDGLYDLGEELNQQFTQIRHRAAASELKHLRHLFDQVAEHLNTLIEFRNSLLTEIRQTDANGAQAILNARSDFVQFAREHGFWQARLKQVGPWPVTAPVVEAEVNLDPFHQRMATLETEKNELQRRISDFQRQSDGLKSQLATLELERQSWSVNRDADLLEKLQSIDREMESTQMELSRLMNQLSELSPLSKPAPNAILTQASEILSAVPELNINQVWLEEAKRGVGFEIQSSDGTVHPIGQLTAMAQDAVYLALAVAVRESIRDPRRSLPIVIDDAFVNVPRQQADQFVNLLKRIQQSGHQLILLTNHQYLADRFTDAPVFELSGPVTMPQPTFPIEREFNSEIVITPPVRAANRKSDDSQVLIQHASDFQPWNEPVAFPISSAQESHSHSTRSRESVYPFSKYTHPGNSQLNVHLNSQPDLQSFTEEDYYHHPGETLQPVRIHSGSPAASTAETVALEKIGDRINLAPSVQDETLLESIQLLNINQLRALNELQIETVVDLLTLEYDLVVEPLRNHHISREQITNWQSTLWLLSTVPGLSLTDARLLVACGILEPDQIATSQADRLLERIERYLATREGNRYGGTSYQLSQNRIRHWQRAISETRSRWQSGCSGYVRRIVDDRRNRFTRAIPRDTPARVSHSNRRADLTLDRDRDRDRHNRDLQQGANARDQRQNRPSRSPFDDPSVARQPRMASPQPGADSRPESRRDPRSNNRSDVSLSPAASHSQNEPRDRHQVRDRNGHRSETAAAATTSGDRLRFYLDLQDHIEAAPSIGPKTAVRFEKIGIRTVDQFLNQTAESMASKLNYKRITPDLIRDWQHQSRLVCRIPNLRGHDAQLLVACGYREPELIAEMSPQKLLDVILPFSRGKEGLKIIRTGKEPDLEEITNWIDWAGKTRSLNAA